MKKLYRKKPSTSSSVHPSPDHLLPAFILTLAAALSPSDKEVLSYLISHQTDKKHFKDKEKHNNHSPVFTCDCFRCYTSYWARWDTSVNRHVIHDIIDAYEDDLAKSKKVTKTRKERKKKGMARVASELTQSEPDLKTEVTSSERVETELTQPESESVGLRKLVSYIGGRFWGVWN